MGIWAFLDTAWGGEYHYGLHEKPFGNIRSLTYVHIYMSQKYCCQECILWQ